MQRTDPLEKALMLGKIEGRRRTGQQRMRWLNGISNSMDMSLSCMEKEMATHSSTLAWRISSTEEPGGLPSLHSQRVRHDWATNIHTHTQTHTHRQLYGEGNGNPLQYSCLENLIERGAGQATVHGVSRVRHDWATNTHSQAPGVDDEQGGLACCSSWCCKELDTTEWLNWTELRRIISLEVFLSVTCNKKDE